MTIIFSIRIMKKISLITLLIILSGKLFSQDIITTGEDKEVKAKVIEVTSENIKYKKYDNPQGPTYTINLTDIKKVKYANGEEEVFGVKSRNNESASASSSSNDNDVPSIFKGKFDIENEETHDYLDALAKNAGTRLLEKCAGHMDNSTVEIFWDQTYRDDIEGVINLAIIVKWDKGLANKQRWIKGIVKIGKQGNRSPSRPGTCCCCRRW